MRTLEAQRTPSGRVCGQRRVITRRRLTVGLGVLWLIDGLLQFQPYMFSSAFSRDVIGMASMGLPPPIAALDDRITTVIAGHPAAWNSAFASLQLLLGVGLLWKRTSRLSLMASVPWAMGVWVIGEGFGGMFMPSTSFLVGAPGAALLYVLAALTLWPRRQEDGDGARVASAVLGPRRALWAWAAVWAGTALLELKPINHAAVVAGATIADGGDAQPAPLRWLDSGVGHLLAHRGPLFAVLTAVAQVAVGLGVLAPATRRPALVAGVAVGVFYGFVGQDLGGVFTGHGTDPGTGPLIILLALALWPRGAAAGARDGEPAGGSTAGARPATASATAARLIHHLPAAAPQWDALGPVGGSTSIGTRCPRQICRSAHGSRDAASVAGV